jgi:hypothetical protein
MTVFVYVNTSKQVGDPEHIKVFAPAIRKRTGAASHRRFPRLGAQPESAQNRPPCGPSCVGLPQKIGPPA